MNIAYNGERSGRRLADGDTGPNTYLHKWWARRSGTTFRHILKQLVPNPAKRNFYEPGGLEGKVILDPMMGGGTTLHEAIRLGANVIGIDGDLRDFEVPTGPKSDDLLRRGITSFIELFTPRQLLYLGTSVSLLPRIPQEDRIWLALLLSTSLEFNSLLCGYKGAGVRRPGAIRHVFSHHAYSFPYTALENNPVFSEKRSGTLKQLFHSRIVKAGKWAIKPVERYFADGKPQTVYLQGEIDGGQPVTEWTTLKKGARKFLVLQEDAAALDIPEGIVNYVVTDPPYYDSVQYSDLSNFFRVWLRLFLPKEADWHYDSLASAVSEGNE